MVEKLILYLFVVLTLVYSNGCKDSGIDIKNLQLVNTSWRLESFETIGVYITPIQDGRVYSITFLPDLGCASKGRLQRLCGDIRNVRQGNRSADCCESSILHRKVLWTRVALLVISGWT